MREHVPAEDDHWHIFSEVSEADGLDSRIDQFEVNLIADQRNFVLSSESENLFHVLPAEDCSHGVGWVDYVHEGCPFVHQLGGLLEIDLEIRVLLQLVGHCLPLEGWTDVLVEGIAEFGD